jgi:hypothetical protein
MEKFTFNGKAVIQFEHELSPQEYGMISLMSSMKLSAPEFQVHLHIPTIFKGVGFFNALRRLWYVLNGGPKALTHAFGPSLRVGIVQNKGDAKPTTSTML